MFTPKLALGAVVNFQYSEHPRGSLEAVLQAIGSMSYEGASFDCVDLHLGDYCHFGEKIFLGPSIHRNQLKATTDFLHQLGLRIGILISRTVGLADCPFGETGQVNRYLDNFKRFCELGQQLEESGCRFGNSIRIDFGKMVPGSPDKALSRLSMTLDQCVAIAQKHGQRIVFEPGPTQLFQNSVPAVAILKSMTSFHPESCGFLVDLAESVHVLQGTTSEDDSMLPDNWQWVAPKDPEAKKHWQTSLQQAWQRYADLVGNRVFDFHVSLSDANRNCGAGGVFVECHKRPFHPASVINPLEVSKHWLMKDGKPNPQIKSISFDFGAITGAETLLRATSVSSDYWVDALELLCKVRSSCGYADF